MPLRSSEWVNLVAFSCLIALAWVLPGLDRQRRVKITTIGAAGAAITLFGALLLPRWADPSAVRVTRDWLPLLMVLLFYRQAGEFVTRADVGVEERLERWDRRLVVPALERCARLPGRAWIFGYLEAAYLSYYAVMPAGIAVLYLAGEARQVDAFWTVVLLASHGSCSTLPFLQTRPPRELGEKWSVPLPHGKLREFNLLILRQGAIHANTCPSAHVAIAAACALGLLGAGLLWAGLIFLWIAVSIAAGAVGGRYHYAADALLGALTAIAAFLAATALI
jgi:hypothetical protein